MMNKKEGVAVIGIGLRLPGGSSSPAQFWRNLMEGVDCVGEIPEDRFSSSFHARGDFSTSRGGFLDLEKEWFSFDPLFFGISPSEASTIDPQQRVLLKVVYEAMEDSMMSPASLRGSKTSVFMGCCFSDFVSQLVSKDENMFLAYDTFLSSISNRVSHVFDLRGASLTIDTACSSSMNAVHLGCQSILSGDSDVSVVGGIEMLLNPMGTIYFSTLGVLSPDGKCKSFDESADGYVRSEGAVVLILKSYEKALRDGDNIYSVINGTSSNADGRYQKQGYYMPSGDAQSENIKAALFKSNVDPSEIHYFECHATGTLGDIQETQGLSKIFQSNHSSTNPLLIGSVKSNVGHNEGVSGACSLAKVCLMMRHRTLVPNIHFNQPNAKIDFDNWHLKVVTKLTPFPENRSLKIGINCFGITGSNTCIIVSEPESSGHRNNDGTKNPIQSILIPISSNSKLSLTSYQSSITEPEFTSQLKSREISLTDFAKTHILARDYCQSQRSVLAIRDWDGYLNQGSTSFISNERDSVSNISSQHRNPILVFVYCGQGPQYREMGLELYQSEPLFKATMDRVDGELSKHFGYSVLEKLRSTSSVDEINDPILAQPSIFLIQCSLSKLYKSKWNVVPNYSLGHSFGELTSAYECGLVSLELACKIVYERSRLQSKTIGSGRMLSISIGEEEFRSRFSNYPGVEVACYNSKDSIVVAGSQADLLEISSALNEENCFTALLGTKCSFHSSSQDKIKSEFYSSLPSTLFNNDSGEFINNKINMFSTTTSLELKRITNDILFDNLRKPVLFQQTIQNLISHINQSEGDETSSNNIVFVEISPTPTLSRYIPNQYPVINPMIKKSNENQVIQFENSIANLYINGYNIDFSIQLKDSGQDLSFKWKCSHLLPHYQWDDQIYSKEALSRYRFRIEGFPTNCLGHRILEQQLPNVQSYKSMINVSKEPFKYLKGHVVSGSIYFPGCGYLDNILKMFPDKDLSVSRLNFMIPFILKPGVECELLTNATQTSRNEYRVDSYFFENEKWNQSSNGKVVLYSFTFPTKQLNIEELKAKCNLSTVEREDIYSYLSTISDINYYDKFRLVERSYIGDGCVLSKIPLERVSKCEKSFLNPAVLDACFHGSFFLFPNSSQQQCVFEKIEHLKVHSSSIPKESDNYTYLYSYSYNAKDYSKMNRMYSSICIMLQDGTVICEASVVSVLSISKIKEPLAIKYPSKHMYKFYWQTYNSVISQINFIDQAQNLPESVNEYSSLLFYHHLSTKVGLTKSIIVNESVDQLQSQYLKSNDLNFFKYIFEKLKLYPNQMIEDQQEYFRVRSQYEHDLNDLIELDKLNTSIQIIVSNLFQGNESVEQSNSLNHSTSHSSVGTMVVESVQDYLFEDCVLRILGIEIEQDILLDILEKYGEILVNSSIQIEFTFASKTIQKIEMIKSKLDQFSNMIHIVYKVFDLELGDFIETQKMKRCDYDIVIMNSLHRSSQLSQSLQEIYKILKFNGNLILLELPRDSFYYNLRFGFEGWPSLPDSRGGNPCMSPSQWQSLLEEKGFINIISSKSDEEHSDFIIISTKPSLDNNSLLKERVIIYGNPKSSLAKEFQNSLAKHYRESVSISNFNQMIEYINNEGVLGSNDIIFNLTAMDKLETSNFEDVSMEYIQLNQELFKASASKCKHVLLSLESVWESKYYLNSSVIGIMKYFKRFNNMVSIDFDELTLENHQISLKLIDQLLMNAGYQYEFAIRNSIVYTEGIKKLSTLPDSLSYESQEFHAEIKPSLEVKLKYRPKKLGPTEIEIKLKSSGLNFRDNLTHRGIVVDHISEFNGTLHYMGFGSEHAGIITGVGEEVKNFKVGDRVCANSTVFGSHVIVEECDTWHIPESISFNEMAALIVTYITVYYSLQKLERFFDVSRHYGVQSILVHSGTGGIGLSTLNILKWKMKQTKKKFYIFCTVSSKEKEEYLVAHYGDMITGIYSSLNNDFVDQIKNQLHQLNYDRDGVDLILNTLSSDFIYSNFQLLSQEGKIIDMSLTHIVNNESIDFTNFKHNISYTSIEILDCNKKFINSMFDEMIESIKKKELDILPIKVYPVSQFKEALEFMSERKHIGKLVIEYDREIITPEVIEGEKYKVIKEDFQVPTNMKCLIITGQQGVVLAVLKWLLKHSQTITDVIVLTKSSSKWQMNLTMNLNKNVKFHFKSVDVGDRGQLDKAMSELYACNPPPPVDSIIHFAYIHTEREMEEITREEFKAVHSVKSFGMINLHEISLSLKWPIQHFIVSASTAAITPSHSQCSYISSCRLLESFSKHRRSLGLPSTCIFFGSLQGAGYVSRNKNVEQNLTSMGVEPVSLNNIFGLFDIILQNPSIDNIILWKTNFELISKHLLKYPQFDYYLNHHLSFQNSSARVNINIRETILSKISESLSIPQSKLNLSIKLRDYGLGSLVLLGLKNWIDLEFQSNLLNVSQISNSNINQLIQLIEKSMNRTQTLAKKPNNPLFVESHPHDFWLKQIELDESVRMAESSKLVEKDKMNVLLTGVTGFLGTHLFVDLLHDERYQTIYCIVRAKSSEEARTRVLESCRLYKIHNQLGAYEKKVVFIAGDLNQPLFGLGQNEFDRLSHSVDIVIHSAARVSYAKLYSEDRDVIGTKQLLKFCVNDKNRIIRFVFISTIHVYFGKKEEEITKIPDLSVINSQFGYAQSKVVQENLIHQAHQRGLHCMILRPPFINFNIDHFVPNPTDIVQNILLASYIIKQCPFLVSESHSLHTVSVNWLCEKILNTVQEKSLWVSNDIPQYNLFGKLQKVNYIIEILSKHYSLPLVDYDEWRNNLKKSAHPLCVKLSLGLTVATVDFFKKIFTSTQHEHQIDGNLKDADIISFIEANKDL